MVCPTMTFYMLILDIMIEGIVSQNFNLGLRFYFIESRK